MTQQKIEAYQRRVNFLDRQVDAPGMPPQQAEIHRGQRGAALAALATAGEANVIPLPARSAPEIVAEAVVEAIAVGAH